LADQQRYIVYSFALDLDFCHIADSLAVFSF